ncbi:MAG TPA: DUF1540 domain-containing protein [Actinobacteria bacterium]|nr:DUF1540 domain-containing protein [Actinomycetota bacterium]
MMGMREEGLISLCMVRNCAFNRDQQCHAPSINVGFTENHADCTTFTPR